MKLFSRIFHMVLAVMFVGAASTAQEINAENWTLSEQGASVVEYQGRQSILLSGGMAQLNSTQFQNGEISFDISMEEKRGFAGVYLRWNDNNAEYFYLRPHMSGKPDANQYTPRFNGLTGWQMYHSARFSTPTTYKFNQWMRVRLVVKDNKMDVYIDSEEPVLHVDNLMGPSEAGSIRFVGAVQKFHISNVVVRQDDAVETVGVAVERPTLADNLIRSFNVGSTAVPANEVEAKAHLPQKLLEGQVWQTLAIDESGSANLAKVSGRTQEANTLFVRQVLTTDTAKTVRFQYGFSDRVTVFLNGRAIAYGDDTYQTRDYRHLGTVGLYDSVFLPLKSGENELVFAVTEAFGGWAIKAAFDPVDGVTLN